MMLEQNCHLVILSVPITMWQKNAEVEVGKQDGCRERNWKGNEEVERGMSVGWGWGGITRVKSGWGWK